MAVSWTADFVRSFSAPNLASSKERRRAGVGRGASGVSRLLEGTLFVAKTDEKGGPPDWEPFHFAHHADGAVSFRPMPQRSVVVGQICGPCKAALPSELVARGANFGDQELYLDADWRQPFIAAPWKPLSHASGSLQAPGGSKSSKVHEMLFPFTLSYTPYQSKPGDAEAATQRRRTIVLAATNAGMRSKWLNSLSQKAQTPNLRPTAPPGPASIAPASYLRGAPAAPPASVLSLSSALRLPKRRFMALGEEHFGLPMAASSSEGLRQPRLPAGPAGLWDASSHLRVVRDLYDGYASDPLSTQCDPGVARRMSFDSSSEVLSGSSTPTRQQLASVHRAKFLHKYIDRQAEIEDLLERKWGTRGEAAQLPKGSSEPETAETSVETPIKETSVTVEPTAPVASLSRELDVEGFVLLRRPELVAKTKNVSLEGDLLTNREWSGGALFAPPDENSFRLTICAIDPLDTNPLFIGVASADADLTKVNIFGNEGVFLCMGGRASNSLISALGAPAGPAFYAHGERQPALLPKLLTGQYLSVHFYIIEGQGMVRFIISEPTGEEVRSAEPELKLPLTTGPWRPCVLLCMPDTRVLIQQLI